MTDLNKTLRALVIAALTIGASPALSLDIQAPDLNPGPQFDLPQDIAPPQENGGGNGGGSAQPNHAGDGSIANGTLRDPCPNGELMVEFEVDADGHPIPTSFSRSCVIRR